jgi:hypothetical protein
LDFYPAVIHPDTGKPTRREFLALYVFERPRNESEKQQNKETRNLAESIRAKRQIEIQAGIYGFWHQAKRRTDFLAYFRNLAEARKEYKNNYDNWMSAYNHLERFANGHCTIADIDENFARTSKIFSSIAPA